MVEQLICNQQVGGSSPSGGFMGGYTVGVAGRTVNALPQARVVRLHLRPLKTLIVKALRLADKLREGTL